MNTRIIETDGSRALRFLSIRARDPISQTEIARALNASASAVCRWMMGWRRPAPTTMREIERLYGISPDAWLTDSERREVARCRKSYERSLEAA